MNDDFSKNERIELLALARHTIEQYLAGGKQESPSTNNKRFMEKRGVFVTLRKLGQLRGCIGYPLPIKPLFQAIANNAISAAFEDPRFSKVKAEEMKDIHIELSVLTVPQEVKGIDEVKLGRDGIIISKGINKGLFLPQVPTEQGWNLEEYISYGCQKAGLPFDQWRREVTIETFKAVVFSEDEIAKKENEEL